MGNKEKVVTYCDYSNGNVEICRDLCNALMQHQAKVCKIHKDILKAMTFENRLKISFEKTKEKLLIVAFDEKRPIGYIFASTEYISEECKNSYPFLEKIEKRSGYLGFVPADVKVGSHIGEIGNLFVYPEYRGLNIGRTLMNQAMDWIKGHNGLKCALVYVSNGNNAGAFYEKYGFQYVHDVMDGIIKAYELKF